MPILNVKVSARRSPEMTRKIAATLLELTSRILGKDPNVTAIAIDYVAPRTGSSADRRWPRKAGRASISTSR